MAFTARIRVSGAVEVGQTVTALIRPVCIGGATLANVNYGIGYGNGRDTAWKKNSSMMYCDQDFPFVFMVTQEMYNQQQAGRPVFVYATDDTSRQNISGAGDGRTAGLSISLPGAEPIKGRVRVATRFEIYDRSWRGEPMCRLYCDYYRDGILKERNEKIGDAYCEPHGRVYDSYMASSWTGRYPVRYARESFYNSRAKDEQEWLIGQGVKVVSADWTPMMGEPGPTCTISGSLSAPSQISAVMKNWVPELKTTSLPVTLPLTLSCADAGKTVSPPSIAGVLPVTFSINDIDIATLYPASAITFDLASYLAAWSRLLTAETTALTLKARVKSQKVGTMRIKAFSTEIAIPVNISYTEGTKRNPETCWDGSVIHTEIFSGGVWVSTGETCPTEPLHGEKRNRTDCWDRSTIHTEKYDATFHRWIPTGEACPASPPDGTKRNLTTCWDGSTIHTEVFAGGAWIPSGEKCPVQFVRRTLEIAVPKIAYEGQAINIVARAFCGAASSHDEDAILTIDGAAIETKKTKAGEVSFRWTAKGVGMHKVCINIPASPSCQVPITKCETMMVSAFVEGIQEQIKREKAAYEGRLTELRKRKKIEAGKVAKPGVPGYVRIPASLAGATIDVGGVAVTVPPGGTTVQVPSGDSIVSVIQEGISTSVPVLVSPGEMINLPTAGLPELPGGI